MARLKNHCKWIMAQKEKGHQMYLRAVFNPERSYSQTLEGNYKHDMETSLAKSTSLKRVHGRNYKSLNEKCAINHTLPSKNNDWCITDSSNIKSF